MTNTTQETLTVDGVVLNTLAKNIKTLSGRLRTAKVRTANVEVPQRNGHIWTPRKWYDPLVLDMPMWVRGCDDDGKIPSQSKARTEFYKRVDELVSLFSSPNLLYIVHTLPDGTKREAYGEVLDILDFTTMGVDPLGMVNVQLVVPGAFWQDTADNTNTFTNPTMGAALSLTNFAGATAPMDDLTYTITGPITNPKVEALRGGAALTSPVYFQYNGTVPSTQTLIVNCKTWALSGTMASSYANLSHTGDARWMVAEPAAAAGTPQVSLSGSGNTAATALSVVGRRKYLVG